jgi:hypothetical protein
MKSKSIYKIENNSSKYISCQIDSQDDTIKCRASIQSATAVAMFLDVVRKNELKRYKMVVTVAGTGSSIPFVVVLPSVVSDGAVGVPVTIARLV